MSLRRALCLASNCSHFLTPIFHHFQFIFRFFWWREACELKRLFQTEFFNANDSKNECQDQFSFHEQQVRIWWIFWLFLRTSENLIFRFSTAVNGSRIRLKIFALNCHHSLLKFRFRLSQTMICSRLVKKNILGIKSEAPAKLAIATERFIFQRRQIFASIRTWIHNSWVPFVFDRLLSRNFGASKNFVRYHVESRQEGREKNEVDWRLRPIQSS